jgi:hypothetical protein
MRRSFVLDEFIKQLEKVEFDLRLNGYDQSAIDGLFSYIFEIIYVKIPRGELRPDPVFIATEEGNGEYSVYSFSSGPISGSYASNPEDVRFKEIHLNNSFFNQNVFLITDFEKTDEA